MHAVDSGRTVRSFTQQIEAPPESVFPLLCPVREAEWLDGWADEVEIVHSDSGLAEDGCVFRTRAPGRPETVWMITRHDPVQRIVEFFRVTAGLVATRLQIGVAARAEIASSVRIVYTFTPLSPAGVAFVSEKYSEEAFREDMTWWQDSMNHWLAGGEILRAPAERP